VLVDFKKKRRRRIAKKRLFKLAAGKCFFCPERDYSVLDNHRIEPGGKYVPHNVLVICSNCHRKEQRGKIRIDRKYATTSGRMVLRYFRGKKEYWKPLVGGHF